MYGWNTLPWTRIQRQVFKLQKRMYRATRDTLEVDHIIPKAQGGNESDDNLQLLHRHCHARKTAQDSRGQGTFDTRHGAEEPDDAKASRPVSNPSRGGDTPA